MPRYEGDRAWLVRERNADGSFDVTLSEPIDERTWVHLFGEIPE